MRSAAKVFPALSWRTSGVPTEGGAAGNARAFGVVELVLRAFSLDFLESFGSGHFIARERAVLGDDLCHLRFHGGKVIGGHGAFALETDVVIEAGVDGWAVDEFGIWEEALDGLGHDVRGAMTDEEEPVGIGAAFALLGGDDGE